MSIKKFLKASQNFIIKHVPKKYLIKYSYYCRYFLSIYCYGKKVYCPICERYFRKFLPYGVAVRENVLCPGCFSLERHRLLWLYLKNKTDIFTRKIRLLHFSPQRCLYDKLKKYKNIDYVTADLESPLADYKIDIQHISLADNQFDYIICYHILEHVKNDYKAAKELYRVLKPGGSVFLQVPIDENRQETYEDPGVTKPMERRQHFGQEDHYRFYGLDFPRRLEKAGLKVKEINFTRELDKDFIEKCKLVQNELFYIGNK